MTRARYWRYLPPFRSGDVVVWDTRRLIVVSESLDGLGFFDPVTVVRWSSSRKEFVVETAPANGLRLLPPERPRVPVGCKFGELSSGSPRLFVQQLDGDPETVKVEWLPGAADPETKTTFVLPRAAVSRLPVRARFRL